MAPDSPYSATEQRSAMQRLLDDDLSEFGGGDGPNSMHSFHMEDAIRRVRALSVLGGAGVIGIALGFAMRDTIENYVASLLLSLRQPFRANDLVLIDDMEGRVVRLTSRATVLMTLDGNHLRIPNGQVFRAVILNFTRNPQRRFDFALGVDPDDDSTAAAELGRETLAGLPFVLADPPPEEREVGAHVDAIVADDSII